MKKNLLKRLCFAVAIFLCGFVAAIETTSMFPDRSHVGHWYNIWIAMFFAGWFIYRVLRDDKQD